MKTKVFTNFKEEDGVLLGSRSNRTIALSNGEVWILGDEGINSIDPKALFEEKNSIPPKVWITNMTIMDSSYAAPDGDIFTKAIDFTDEIEIAYWQKNLTFEFVALHYLRPEDNQYCWMLEGYDEQWTEPSLNRTASYTNLSPGTYTFRVKGSNADGIWNEEGATMKITILPPYWQTVWAYGIYFLAFCGLGFLFIRSQKEAATRKEKDRSRDRELAQAKEVEKAYTTLKSTQSQLIQSEKMASLGELTAGIAHEIQNPLNFVNNFSEINIELIEELQAELKKGDYEEVLTISEDVKDNQQKINHHGKRADAIVKGMLQHSRKSTAIKEPTDINKLADEYLRLAYHGLRAKDKSFNATLETDFDENLGLVNVIPQDLGRVILNLITNAFYAVNEQKTAFAKANKEYAPTVSIITKKEGNTVRIIVKDNGNGMPQEIVDKIFQPFFTTKPTGEGTGLGLSMSYDIVSQGHGGTLNVNTQKGEGTEFIISIPNQAI
jgi:signal transduction histidine kinase